MCGDHVRYVRAAGGRSPAAAKVDAVRRTPSGGCPRLRDRPTATTPSLQRLLPVSDANPPVYFHSKQIVQVAPATPYRLLVPADAARTVHRGRAFDEGSGICRHTHRSQAMRTDRIRLRSGLAELPVPLPEDAADLIARIMLEPRQLPPPAAEAVEPGSQTRKQEQESGRNANRCCQPATDPGESRKQDAPLRQGLGGHGGDYDEDPSDEPTCADLAAPPAAQVGKEFPLKDIFLTSFQRLPGLHSRTQPLNWQMGGPAIRHAAYWRSAEWCRIHALARPRIRH